MPWNDGMVPRQQQKVGTIISLSIPAGTKGQSMRLIHWIWAAITGFIVGLIARAVLPGSDQMGFLMTTALGILGSLIGGFLGSLIKKPVEGARFHPAGFLLSVIGAILLLLLWRYIG
jgi:uncharacterized membrane protein YeaQ/YmgE (transglycosylase-associated protein family)